MEATCSAKRSRMSELRREASHPEGTLESGRRLHNVCQLEVFLLFSLGVIGGGVCWRRVKIKSPNVIKHLGFFML